MIRKQINAIRRRLTLVRASRYVNRMDTYGNRTRKTYNPYPRLLVDTKMRTNTVNFVILLCKHTQVRRKGEIVNKTYSGTDVLFWHRCYPTFPRIKFQTKHSLANEM